MSMPERWKELSKLVGREMSSILVHSTSMGASSFINDLNYYREQFRGEYYDNNNLKGKKMNNVFQVLAIQEFIEGSPLPKILVPITTVVAKDEQTAVQNFLIENAAELKDKENVQTLCRPFC